MFRKPVFWIALVAASAAGVLFSVRYFSRAFPIVTLDLRMDRAAALSRARELDGRFRLGPGGYEAAASFGNDQEAQNFVELEGGGTEAFKRMMAAGLYHPYTWTVRHFKPGETRETRFRFNPRGESYGFALKLPEKEPGAALDGAAARRIAEQSGAGDWGLDFGRYQLVEQSQEVRPGGRIDHTLVYERPDVRAGEGRYRLRLVVGGDRLTQVSHFLKVPEAFSRRYEAMRSANNVINVAGSVVMLILYIVIGCGVGLFFLMRQRWVIWRKPVVWGLVIAALQLAAAANQWPLVWMTYDTAISRQGFALQQITMMLANFLVTALLLIISFMAAESLDRRAFFRHIQLWRVWSPGVANSAPILGMTVTGYLLVGVFFAYEVFLYFFTTRTLGWWTPSDVLVQPDVLATYMPWLSAIAPSSQAGFWEESLFRAVPLAGAALLGNRFGRRGWWLAGAMVVQALIFGAGHAGYANQPSYARVVELIVPSMMFGALYLVFGLLPGIVLHYAFDVVWFALPLFVSTAPGIWLQRGMVVALVLVPLWVVLWRTARSGVRREAPETELNGAWVPSEAAVPLHEEEPIVVGRLNPAVARALPLVGLVGLVLWFGLAQFRTDAPPLAIDRAAARDQAARALSAQGVQTSSPWRVLSELVAQPGQADRFVWQTAGRDTYRRLTGEYLAEPHWVIRYAQFEGDVAARAEEYRVAVSDRGAFRILHKLPEARPGATLSETEARSLALATLRDRFGVGREAVREVSSEPSKLAARTDWLFTFADARRTLPQGELRLAVQIAGDTVADAYRFVYVPEEWARAERDRRAVPQIVGVASSVLVALTLVAGAIAAIVRWGRRDYPSRTFAVVLAVLFVLSAANLVNSLPAVTAQFSTAQPWKVQLFMFLALGIVGLLLLAGGMGLVAGLVRRWSPPAGIPRGTAWLAGASLGGVAAGVAAAGASLRPSLGPVWPEYSALATAFPLLDSLLDAGTGLIQQSTVALLALGAAHAFTQGWRRQRSLGVTLLVVFGLVAAGIRPIETLASWLGAGLLLGIFLIAAYVAVVRFAFVPVVMAVAALQALALARHALQHPYPSATAAAAAALAATAAATWLASREVASPESRLEPVVSPFVIEGP